MKHFILTFIFCISCFISANAQWTSTKVEAGRNFYHINTYLIDEGIFFFSTNEAIFNISLANDSFDYRQSEYISFIGYEYINVEFYDESNRQIDKMRIDIYCDDVNQAHSTFETDDTRKILSYIKNKKGFIKLNIPVKGNKTFDFIVFTLKTLDTI